jgi:class 3 adenylate cyclase/YHS domain-containing protein
VQTFIFADLAGFTALTEAHGDERAAEVASSFCRRVGELAAASGASLVKEIGDAALLRSPDAAAAIGLGLSILEEEGKRPDSPAVRIGMHSGSAVERDGDWFGAAVNVAARVAALAAAGEVVLTDATAEAAGVLEDVELERLGGRQLKNVHEPVQLLRATRRGAHRGSALIDPVCRMALAEGAWIGSLSFGDRRYYFCSMECARRFTADPERYAGG